MGDCDRGANRVWSHCFTHRAIPRLLAKSSLEKQSNRGFKISAKVVVLACIDRGIGFSSLVVADSTSGDLAGLQPLGDRGSRHICYLPSAQCIDLL